MSVWIEAALNGPWSRARQRLIPVTVEEIVADGIACARAGAAVVHVHAYDPTTGLQNDDPDTYAAIIDGIRSVEDVIVYPTIPFIQSADAFRPGAPDVRFRAVEALAERGSLEWAVVDPGSTNLATFAEIKTGGAGSIYLNPGEHIRRGLELAARYRFVPSYAIYEPGFVRLGAALARAVPGCHVRVDLEDAPFGTETPNVAWVESARSLVERVGGRVASAAEIRRDLQVPVSS